MTAEFRKAPETNELRSVRFKFPIIPQTATSRAGAGGKIVTNRRKQRLSATPFDRAPQPTAPIPPPKSTNFFTGTIIPSARAIASGAGKIISYIYSESESSSSEDEDSTSEEDAYVGDGNEISNHGVNELNEENMVSSEMVQHRVESQLKVQQPETKRLIEQLIKKESFSREECDRLIKVLNSRVMDWSLQAVDKSLLAGSPGTTVDHEAVDIYDHAVLEAKKWFQEKKVGSSPRRVFTQASFDLNSPDLRQVEIEGGSPIDLAKLYMRDRPPWASQMNRIELQTPLTTTMKPVKEDASYSVGRNSFCPLKHRSSLASGLWNIQEELQRVRSKVTEVMLRNSLTKIDASAFETASSWKELGATGQVSSAMEERNGPQSVKKNLPTNAGVDVGVSSDPELAAVELRPDGKESETLPSRLATPLSRNNQEALQMDDKYVTSTVLNPSIPNHSEGHQMGENKVKGPPTVVTEQTVTGFSLSQASLSAGGTARHNHELQYDRNNYDSEIASGNRFVNVSIEKENQQLSTEAVEVPVFTETSSIASGSQNSLELSLDTTLSSIKGITDAPYRKRQGRKPGKNSRRGKGRGK